MRGGARKGAGRKPLAPRISLAIKMPLSLAETIEAQAKQDGITRHAKIIAILAEWARKYLPAS